MAKPRQKPPKPPKAPVNVQAIAAANERAFAQRRQEKAQRVIEAARAARRAFGDDVLIECLICRTPMRAVRSTRKTCSPTCRTVLARRLRGRVAKKPTTVERVRLPSGVTYTEKKTVYRIPGIVQNAEPKRDRGFK